MVDKKKAAARKAADRSGSSPPATLEDAGVNRSGQRARVHHDDTSRETSQLRRRFALPGADVISGFEQAARPARRLTGTTGPAARNTKEYGDLTGVREEVRPPRRADSRSEEPAVRDFVPEREVGEGGVATPRPKLPLAAVPRRKMGEEQLRSLPLDHRAGFVLAHIDGKTSMRTLLDVCGMSHDEIASVLDRLVQLRAIDLG